MTKTLIALAVVAAYLGMGVATFETTKASAKDACIAAPTYAAHVALWPVSYGTSAGLRSAC